MIDRTERHPPIEEILAMHERVKEAEKTDPILARLVEMRRLVRQEPNKIDEHVYSVKRLQEDGSGFHYYSDWGGSSGNISIAETAPEKDDRGINRIKTKVLYRGNAYLFASVDFTLTGEDILESFEYPGESVIDPNDIYRHSVRGQWRDTFHVEGPSDSHGPNTRAFIARFIERADFQLAP